MAQRRKEQVHLAATLNTPGKNDAEKALKIWRRDWKKREIGLNMSKASRYVSFPITALFSPEL
jgi:predicted GIY-YIG superfamily endonuclease